MISPCQRIWTLSLNAWNWIEDDRQRRQRCWKLFHFSDAPFHWKNKSKRSRAKSNEKFQPWLKVMGCAAHGDDVELEWGLISCESQLLLGNLDNIEVLFSEEQGKKVKEKKKWNWNFFSFYPYHWLPPLSDVVVLGKEMRKFSVCRICVSSLDCTQPKNFFSLTETFPFDVLFSCFRPHHRRHRLANKNFCVHCALRTSFSRQHMRRDIPTTRIRVKNVWLQK